MIARMSVAALLAGVAVAQQELRRDFVVDGEPLAVIERGASWKRGDGFLEASGTGRHLLGSHAAGTGDVRVTARLTLAELHGTAASLVIGGSHFGFDARGGGVFVEGPLFGGGPRRPDRPSTVPEGRPFDVEVVRRGGELLLRLDGEVIHRQRVGDGMLGTVALRPWRATMRVHAFVAEGDLQPLEVPEGPWVSGLDGYHTFRIPALVATTSGTLLAFCEGRRHGRGDSGDIDLLVKRSADNGRTWNDQQVVWDDGPNTCGNPCPVVDRETGVVWLLMTHNLGEDREPEIITRKSQGTRTVWVTSSDDDGRSWAEPREITAAVKRDDWTWYATGPGVGIQLRQGERAGRLLVPCDHIEAETKKYYSHVIWSDDHGGSWELGGSSPVDRVNECQVAERSDGTLLLNMRNYDRSRRTRARCVSLDGGATWEEFRHEPVLVEPICQASLIRYRPGDPDDSRMLFSNPASRDRRVAMTVRLSPDGGESWPAAVLLHPGPAAYSCLCALPDGGIGCLFEAGVLEPYETIAFARLDVSELASTAGGR